MGIDEQDLYLIIRKFALKNAIEHNGKCNRDIVRNMCIGYLKQNNCEINKELLDKLEELL